MADVYAIFRYILQRKHFLCSILSKHLPVNNQHDWFKKQKKTAKAQQTEAAHVAQLYDRQRERKK